MSDDTITIRGQATLALSDQLRFAETTYAKTFLIGMALVVPLFGAIWAFTLSDADWIGLRTAPLHSLGHFVADIWPFYLAMAAWLVLATVGRTWWSFVRFPHVNRQLSFEVTAAGVMTRDAANFSLMVPWASIIRTRNTDHALYIQLVSRTWRYLLWRAFAPEDRDQILRWATRQHGAAGALVERI